MGEWGTMSWVADRKAWCCTHRNVGCQHYDCNAGLDKCAIEWSGSKKMWCFHVEKKPCTLPNSPTPSPLRSRTPAPAPWAVQHSLRIMNAEEASPSQFSMDWQRYLLTPTSFLSGIIASVCVVYAGMLVARRIRPQRDAREDRGFLGSSLHNTWAQYEHLEPCHEALQ